MTFDMISDIIRNNNYDKRDRNSQKQILRTYQTKR